MNCNNYENCSTNERATLRHPTDNLALYANRVYDNQTANRRCYEMNPIDIIEGFGFSNDVIKNILKLVIIVLVAYVIYALIRDMNKTEVKLNVDTVQPASISSIKF